MNRHINLKFLKTLFFQLIASYFIIISILLIFNYVSSKFLINNIEGEMIKNTDDRFSFITQKLDEKFLETKKIMLKIAYNDTIPPITSGRNLDPYSRKLIINYLTSTEITNELREAYIDKIFIITKGLDEDIITSSGMYEKQNYFKTFYNNAFYTEEFWLSEMKKEFTFKYYSCGYFFDNSLVLKEKQQKTIFLPFAFKNRLYENFIMVALIKVDMLLDSIDTNFFNSFYIQDSDGAELYSGKDNLNIENINLSSYDSYEKIEDGYIFSFESQNSGLIYKSFLPNSILTGQMTRINFIYKLIAVLSLLFSILLSIFIVRKFNNPVRQIVETIKKTFDNKHEMKNHIASLSILSDNIKKIVAQNRTYANDLNVKNSMLESFILHAKIRNVYVNVKDQLSIKNNYIIVLFKIHFKPSFYNTVSADSSEATFCLTELIRLYVSLHFDDSITFQDENDQIASIINLKEGNISVRDEILGIADKLKVEEEYAYFTIVVSEIMDNISDLHKIYNKVLENVDYRLLTPETQILFDNKVKENSIRFYYSLAQTEQFMNQIGCGNKHESIRFANDILENNYKKGLCALHIRLLFLEIVNCCIKVLQKQYFDVPKEIEINNIYHSANKMSTIDEYKALCNHLISGVIDYINSHKKESDYIVDFIINYIDSHFSEDIYVDILAEKLDRSSSYISFYFKDKYGTNLTDYINSFRTEKAKELLERSSMKIKDISSKVGFSNVNTFIRLFKKYTGKTPFEYRNELLRNV